jgi:hypothetical protein
MKKIMLLIGVLVALVLPTVASAAVTARYVYDENGDLSLACVDVTTDGIPTNGKPISVNFNSASGPGSGVLKFWGPDGDYARGFCVSALTYFEGGGYGWTATAKVGGTSLGSTVF